MKRLIALILTCGCVLSLTACGSKEEGKEEAATVNAAAEKADGFVVEKGSNKSAAGESDTDVYVDFYGVWDEGNARVEWYQEKAEEFAKQFEEENGVSVKIEYVSQGGYDGVAEKLTAGAVSGELPVMAQIEETFLQQFYPICTDLSGYVSEEVINNYMDGLKVSCYMNDTLYAVPGGRSYAVLYVNNELLEQAGHSKDEVVTWDDLHTIAKDVAALGGDVEGYGVIWDTDAWLWESPLYSNGGNITNEDGTIVEFNKDGAGSIYLQLVQEMLNDGSAYSPYGGSVDPYDAAIEKFAKGELGMFLASCTSYGSMRVLMEEGGYTTDISVIDQPAGKAGNSVVTGGSNYIICNKATETQKKVAAAFLEYLSTDKNQAEWNSVSGYLATTDSVYESEYFEENKKDANLVQIAEGIQYAHSRPQTKHWREMYLYIVEKLEALSMKPNDYECNALVEEMAEYCQTIIDNGN